MDIASLGLRIDSSQAAAAVPTLDKLTASAAAAASAEQKLYTASTAAATAHVAAVSATSKLAAEQVRSSNLVGAAATSAKQTAQALRLVPAQITDIVTQIAGGQSAFLVAIQQGGQLRDSFGGIGAALKGVASVISPTTLAIGGLALTAAAAAKSLYDAQNQSFALEKSITLSGNAAGVTKRELEGMVDALGLLGNSRSAAVETLTAIVQTGSVARENLKGVAQAALALQRAGGAPIEQTIKEFAALGDDPVKAAEALQKKYNFLTTAVYDQIQALRDEGRVAEASSLAQQTYFDEINRRATDLKENIHDIPSLWSAMVSAINSAGARITANGGLRRSTGPIAAAEQARAATANASQAALDQIKAAGDAKRAADFDAARLQRSIDQVAFSATGPTAAASLQSNLAAIQRTLTASETAFQTYQSVIDAQHTAGLVTDRQYYDARRELIDIDRDAQVKAAQAQIRLLDAESERLRKSAVPTGTAKLDQAEQLKAVLAIQPALLANETKRKDLLEEIGKLTASSSAQTAIVNIQEEAAVKALAAGYASAAKSAADYLDVQKRRQDLELAGQGAGNRQRQFNRSISDIESRYQDQRQELDAARAAAEFRGPLSEDAKKLYDQRLQLINDSQSKELKSYDEYYKKLTEKQDSFFVGAAEAFHNYVDESKNSAAQVAEALSRGMESATDALVKFVKTGKLDFKSLVDSIITDLLRIQLQKGLTSVLSGALGGIFGGIAGGLSGSSGVGELAGGSVLYAASGTNYVPRDNQPAILHKGEAVIPKAYNPWAGGKSMGGDNVINVNVSSVVNPAPGTNPAQLQNYIDQRDSQIKTEIYNNLRRGRWPGATGGKNN